jgi:4-amino-4-deoxy-L-arabinose transferase-like glycosyltransferase
VKTRSIDTFCARHYWLLAVSVLGLAAFNVTFRLGREVVNEWDESLYAISAWEMAKSGNFVATTFLGALDYYNSKPPLNVWLIVLSFKLFGTSVASLRLTSAVSAWLTVAVLQAWLRRSVGPAAALASSLVLATMFGFVYVHSGRSAETDALFTLLVLLTVVALWAERNNRWHRIWLGPLAAGAFLLRGAAVLMPLAIVLAVLVGRRRRVSAGLLPTAAALLLFVVPAGAWIVARWRIDRWQFFARMIDYDLVARSTSAIEGHSGTPLYYLNILQKHHYDWLVAAAIALLVVPVRWQWLRDRARPIWEGKDDFGVVIGSWAAVTFMIPTVMQTKVPWYLNPFYPVFATAVGWILVRSLAAAANASTSRRALLGGVVVLAVGVAEGKLLWYSFHYRDAARTTQGLLLQERARLRNRTVYFDDWQRADMFVAGGVIGAASRPATPVEDFWRVSGPGDCIVSSAIPGRDVVLIRSGPHRSLYCRPE